MGCVSTARISFTLRKTWFRRPTLNRLEGLFGRDRELDTLSTQLTDLKTKAYADKRLEPKELEAIAARMAEVEKKFIQDSAARGYPVRASLMYGRGPDQGALTGW